MRYTTRPTGDSRQNTPSSPSAPSKAITLEPIKMVVEETAALVDRLQAVTVNESQQTLVLLKQRLGDRFTGDKCASAMDKIEQLRQFHYNIGFAGGQSCGKSTLVNALIQYPLMSMCVLATTCTPVELVYSQRVRIIAKDDDTKKVILDYDCHKCSQSDFSKLLRYACGVTETAKIENLQYYTDVDICDRIGKVNPEELEMTASDPKHVAVLLMILLTVYVNQNKSEHNASEEAVLRLREETLRYFHISPKINNMSITIQWDHPLLKSGIKFTDLPGLGAAAEDRTLENGSVLNGHDTITLNAIKNTDTMVVINTPEVNGEVLKALRKMLEILQAREAINPSGSIVPVLNRADSVAKGQLQTAISNFCSILNAEMPDSAQGKTPEDIFCTAAWFGEANSNYTALAGDGGNMRTLYCMRQVRELKNNGYEDEEIQEKLPSINGDLNRAFQKRGGIIELREFFRTTFLERGKLEKIYATLVKMKDLEGNLVAELDSTIKTNEQFNGVNRDVARSALKQIRESAQVPIYDAMSQISEQIQKQQRNKTILVSLSENIAVSYLSEFNKALDAYVDENYQIALKLKLSHLLHSGEARIDAAATNNYIIYADLLARSQTFSVSMSAVNSRLANTIAFCYRDIENIYSDAGRWLRSFSANYADKVKEKIDKYREKASGDVVRILDDMVPVLVRYIQDMVNSTDAALEQAREDSQESGKKLTENVIQMNNDLVKIHAEHLQKKVNIQSYGLFFEGHKYVQVTGENGILEGIRSASLTEADREIIRQQIKNMCLDCLINPLNEWFADAEENITDIYVGMQQRIEELLETTERNIQSGVAQMDAAIKSARSRKAVIEEVFADLRNALREDVVHTNAEYKNAWTGTTLMHWFEQINA